MARHTCVLFLSMLIARTRGVDYLMAFPSDKISSFTARTNETGVEVSLSFPGNASTMNVTASNDDYRNEKFFQIPAAWRTDEGVEDKAVIVHVPDNRSATIYGFGGIHVKFTPLPVPNLGTYHIVNGCGRLQGPVILVIATINETKIEITFGIQASPLMYHGNTFVTGDKLTLRLAKYQTLTLKCNCSFVHTEVKSSLSVAVFMWSDNFVQILPWKLAGSEFIIDSVFKDYPFDVLRISTLKSADLLMSNGTKVQLSAGLNRVVFSNDHMLYFNTTKPCIVTSCSANDYLLSNILPTSLYNNGQCYMPSCWANYGSPDIRIMTSELSDVQVSNVDHVNWTTLPGTSYKVGVAKDLNFYRSSSVVSSYSAFNLMFTCPYPTYFFTNCGYPVDNRDVTDTGIRFLEEKEQSEETFEKYLSSLNVYLFAFPQVRGPAILASTWNSKGSLEVRLRSGYQVNVTVQPHQSRQILLSDGLNNGSFLARVSQQTGVYGDYYKYDTSEFAPLPIKALGKEYTIVICEEHGTSSVTIATHFYPANVSILFSIENENGSVSIQDRQYKDGDIVVVTLGRFQTFTFSSPLVLTGTLISSNETVAVFKEYPSFVQLLPNELANTEYVVSKLDFEQSLVSGNELSVTSLYDHTTIRYGQQEYELSRKGTFKSHFSLFEVLHLKSNKPILVHTCSYQAYQDVVPPTSLFPSECVLPICLPLFKPQFVVILTNNKSEVHVSDAYVKWSNVEGTDFKRGKAQVESDRPVHVSSSSKFNVLAVCPMTPFFTYCGLDMFNIDYPEVDDTQQPNNNYPTLTEDLDNAYLIAFPTIETDCQPAVEVYTGPSAGVIHINTSRGVSASLRVPPNSYGNITRHEWWSREGLDSGALILRNLAGSQIYIYGGCHRYHYDITYKREPNKSFAPIPMSALGKKYTLVVCGFYQRSFSVAAYTDSTTVSIKFVFKNPDESIQFRNQTYKTGDVLVQHLQKFGTLTFSSNLDITGTTITSLEPVGVFYHSDNLIQLLPDQLAGQEFVVSKITDVNNPFDRYNLLFSSEHDNYHVVFAEETYHIKRKGQFQREFLLHEDLHFRTTKPVLVHTCTFNIILNVIPPVAILPSQCILPICQPYEKPENIIILSNSTRDVDLTNAKFDWQDTHKSNFMRGMAEVKSRVPVSVKSENRFYLIAACQSSAYATSCGYNISNTDGYQPHDPIDALYPDSGQNTSYLLAFPGGQPDTQPVVEMYSFGTQLIIQTNTNYDIITNSHSNYSISRPDWLCFLEGVENKSIIITKTGANEANVYAGYHTYTRYDGFKRTESTLRPLIPINALGKEYTVVVCESIARSVMSMTIATHFYPANVTIHFVFADQKGSIIFNKTRYQHGDKFEYHLKEYQTLSMSVSYDITGTRIVSTESVGVFLHRPNFVQLFPDILADQEFVVSIFNISWSDTSYLIITSVYDNTDVLFPKYRNHIQRKGTIRLVFLSRETPYFRTTKPVLVHTCSSRFHLNIIPPTSMFPSQCTLPLCSHTYRPEDIIILSHNTTLVNVSDAELQWTDIKSSDYKFGRTQVRTGDPVRVTSPSRFNVLSSCPLSSYFTYCSFNISMSHFPVLVNQSVEDNEIFVEEKPVWRSSETEVIAITVTILVLLLVLMGTLPYYLWRRRAVFIMKLVYRFQAYEDNDDREFDAFISYRSTEEDERFVVHTLFPKLEKELNFKVCVHFRDFMPGETIANNIIEAVEKSRRTILVMSPAYVRSEFCRFEYQRAQHQMLKQKQRIIPIIFKNITDAAPYMDETLRTILNSITYLEWPGDNDEKKIKQFWEKLVLAMPKVCRKKSYVNNNLVDVRQHGDVIHVDADEVDKHENGIHNDDVIRVDADEVDDHENVIHNNDVILVDADEVDERESVIHNNDVFEDDDTELFELKKT